MLLSPPKFFESYNLNWLMLHVAPKSTTAQAYTSAELVFFTFHVKGFRVCVFRPSNKLSADSLKLTGLLEPITERCNDKRPVVAVGSVSAVGVPHISN